MHDAIVENNGGAVGMGIKPCQGGGGAFVAEFNIASINCWAALEVFTAAWGTAGRPRTRGADREWERDQV